MKIKFISFLVAMFCLMSCIMPLVISSTDITPRWDNSLSVSVDVYFINTSGMIDVHIYGNSEISNITATATLYHKNWLGIWVESGEEWSYNVNQSYLSASESFTGKSGRQYEVELTGTVTKNGYAESISASATAEC